MSRLETDEVGSDAAGHPPKYHVVLQKKKNLEDTENLTCNIHLTTATCYCTIRVRDVRAKQATKTTE